METSIAHLLKMRKVRVSCRFMFLCSLIKVLLRLMEIHIFDCTANYELVPYRLSSWFFSLVYSSNIHDTAQGRDG
jgi:hypothetical protein